MIEVRPPRSRVRSAGNSSTLRQWSPQAVARYVYTVTVDIIVVDDHIADVRADSKRDVLSVMPHSIAD